MLLQQTQESSNFSINNTTQCLVVTNLCKNWPIFLFGNEQMDNEHWRSSELHWRKKRSSAGNLEYTGNWVTGHWVSENQGFLGMPSIYVYCQESVCLGEWNESIRELHNPITSCHAWHVHDTSLSQAGICDAMWRGRIWVIANHNQPIANNCTSQFCPPALSTDTAPSCVAPGLCQALEKVSWSIVLFTAKSPQIKF